MKKISSVLMIVLFALAGTSFAAVTGSSYGVADTPQAQPPVDCKKDPTDPRCKKGK
jgi:hypothetical protein